MSPALLAKKNSSVIMVNSCTDLGLHIMEYGSSPYVCRDGMGKKWSLH